MGYSQSPDEAARLRDRVAVCLSQHINMNFHASHYTIPDVMMSMLHFLCSLATPLAVPLLRRAPEYALVSGVKVKPYNKMIILPYTTPENSFEEMFCFPLPDEVLQYYGIRLPMLQLPRFLHPQACSYLGYAAQQSHRLKLRQLDLLECFADALRCVDLSMHVMPDESVKLQLLHVTAAESSLRVRQLHHWAKSTMGGVMMEYEEAGTGDGVVEYVGVKVQASKVRVGLGLGSGCQSAGK